MSAAPFYAPEVRLRLGGKPAPAPLRGSVTAIDCQTGIGGSDRLEMTLVNERLRWLDHPLFQLGKKISFAIGYAPDVPTQLFVGEVTGTEATFPSDGVPTLRVVAQDHRARLAKPSPARLFATPIPEVGLTPLPDVVVLPMVAREHGLKTTDPLGTFLSAALSIADMGAAADDPGLRQRDARKQHSESTLEFLERIASDNGWHVLVDHGPGGDGSLVRLVSPAGDLTPDVTLRYGESLVDFAPRISKIGQVESVSVHVWRPEIKLELTVTVGYDWQKKSLDIHISPGFGPKPGSPDKVLLVNEPVTISSAPRVILSKLLPRLNRRLTAKGSCVGNPKIAAGHVLRVEGVGVAFGGLYRIAQARHTLDEGGYRTSFELRKEIWFDAIPAPEQGAVHVMSSQPAAAG